MMLVDNCHFGFAEWSLFRHGDLNFMSAPWINRLSICSRSSKDFCHCWPLPQAPKPCRSWNRDMVTDTCLTLTCCGSSPSRMSSKTSNQNPYQPPIPTTSGTCHQVKWLIHALKEIRLGLSCHMTFPENLLGHTWSNYRNMAFGIF